MRLHPFAKITGGLAVLATVLAACVVVEERPPPRPGPGPGEPVMCTQEPGPGEPVMCTQEYDPVCGQRRGDRQTFGNACFARAEGYRIVHRGECRPGGPGGRPPPQQACTREYAPVCARQGRDVRTFGNACEAEVANYRILRPGQC